MNECPDFEQSYYSGTAKYKEVVGHDCIRIMQKLAFFERSYYEKKNY